MERTIKVTGKAKIAVAPDTLHLLIDLDDTKPTYNESRELSIECNAQIGLIGQKEPRIVLGFTPTRITV